MVGYLHFVLHDSPPPSQTHTVIGLTNVIAKPIHILIDNSINNAIFIATHNAINNVIVIVIGNAMAESTANSKAFPMPYPMTYPIVTAQLNLNWSWCLT